LVTEALKLKKDELETNEFSMIYDQEEKLSNEDLIKKIEGKIITDDWAEFINLEPIKNSNTLNGIFN
jgi:hypothetical protein